MVTNQATTTRMFPLILGTALVSVLALAGCKKKDATDDTAITPPPSMTEPAPMPSSQPMPMPNSQNAVNVSQVTLGTTADPVNKSITAPMTRFGVNDPIIVSINTNGAATNAQVTAKLVFQDGQTAGEQSTTMTTTGAETTNVTFTNANGWPAGSYKAEVWINGALAQSTNFTVG